MSLKFGIYLVEQRIVTPEQFCGLVKIQQESAKALPTIALTKNLMTIRQVADVLDTTKSNAEKSFQQVAVEMGYLHAKEVDYLLQIQQTTAETIRGLAVECGLLTERQAAVLYLHFEKNVSKQSQTSRSETSRSETSQSETSQSETSQTQTSTPPASGDRVAETKTNQSASAAQPTTTENASPKRPNFRRRPVIIERENVNV